MNIRFSYFRMILIDMIKSFNECRTKVYIISIEYKTKSKMTKIDILYSFNYLSLFYII